MPREHNEKTMAKYEATIQSIEDEIKEAKSNFEEDLLKIENRIKANQYDDGGDEEDENESEGDDEELNKPRSVIVRHQPHKRIRNESEENGGSIEREQPEPKKVKEERERRNSGSSNSQTSDEK